MSRGNPIDAIHPAVVSAKIARSPHGRASLWGGLVNILQRYCLLDHRPALGIRNPAGYDATAHQRKVDTIDCFTARDHHCFVGRCEARCTWFRVYRSDWRNIVTSHRYVGNSVVAIRVRPGLWQTLTLNLAAKTRCP